MTAPTIQESRLKNGTLTFGVTPKDFSCQATNVRVTPTHEDDGDTVETLCGDTMSPGKKGTYVLAGTVIQDFDHATGFQAYTWDNDNTIVDFSFEPNDITTGTKFVGKCTIVSLEVGGDVNVRLTVDFEFDCQGKPTATWGTLVTTEATTP